MKKIQSRLTILCLALLAAPTIPLAASSAHATDQHATPLPHVTMEKYPDRIQAGLEEYRRELEATASVANPRVPYYIIVPTLQRWTPGSKVRVAFNGGNDALYTKIKSAALRWFKPNGANLDLVFEDAQGHFLHWTPNDRAYAAEIRVGFNSDQNGGYWSLVGTDSNTAAIQGGGPGQESLNLDSFDRALPADWQAIVTHEFGHALGFQHEHQSPAGGCDFRFENDAGYVPTKDAQGWYTTDSAGRRPGLYTYLGGYANYWSKTTVDANLRTIPTTSAFLVGPFDKSSIMKYFFGAFMFIKGDQSPCYTDAENLVVSAQDFVGVAQAYPNDAAAVAQQNSNLQDVLKQITTTQSAPTVIREQAAIRLRVPAPQ